MGTQQPVQLEIYVDDGCLVCSRSLQLARDVQNIFPGISVTVIDLSREEGPHKDLAVAAPTFVLNGRRFSLGNPSLQELADAVNRLLREGET